MRDGKHTEWDFAACAAVMGREIALLRRAGLVQEKAQAQARAREWAGFGKIEAETERLGRELRALDAEREAFFEALGRLVPRTRPGESAPFYALAAALPLEERRELGRLYRELQMETLRVRSAGECFAAFLSEARNMTAAFLEAAFPARGGRLYTRKGAQAAQDLRSMVINHSA